VETTLYHENKEEIQVIFHNSMDLLIFSILNNNNTKLSFNPYRLLAYKTAETNPHFPPPPFSLFL
jgi:hypothetical protein